MANEASSTSIILPEGEAYLVDPILRRMFQDCTAIGISDLGDEQGDRECFICRQPYYQDSEAGREIALKLACGHIFGSRCIESWMKFFDPRGVKGCPLCMKKLWDKDRVPEELEKFRQDMGWYFWLKEWSLKMVYDEDDAKPTGSWVQSGEDLYQALCEELLVYLETKSDIEHVACCVPPGVVYGLELMSFAGFIEAFAASQDGREYEQEQFDRLGSFAPFALAGLADHIQNSADKLTEDDQFPLTDAKTHLRVAKYYLRLEKARETLCNQARESLKRVRTTLD